MTGEDLSEATEQVNFLSQGHEGWVLDCGISEDCNWVLSCSKVGLFQLLLCCLFGIDRVAIFFVRIIQLGFGILRGVKIYHLLLKNGHRILAYKLSM